MASSSIAATSPPWMWPNGLVNSGFASYRTVIVPSAGSMASSCQPSSPATGGIGARPSIESQKAPTRVPAAAPPAAPGSSLTGRSSHSLRRQRLEPDEGYGEAGHDEQWQRGGSTGAPEGRRVGGGGHGGRVVLRDVFAAGRCDRDGTVHGHHEQP